MASDEDEVTFRLLGPMALSLGGREAYLGATRGRKVLAALLLNANADVSFDRLCDALWQEAPPSARQQIHTVVAQLRRALSAQADGVSLVTVHNGYRLNVRPTSIDIMLFASALAEARRAQSAGETDDEIRILQDALALWRGPALSGLAEGYLAGVAARLDEQRLAALEQLLEARLRRGEHAAVIGELTELVAEHPLRESLRADLVLALFEAGRQSEALAVFEDARRQLAEELGLDPGHRLREAHERVLRGEANATGALRSPKDEPRSQVSDFARIRDVADAGPRSFLPRSSSEFTGRGEEISRLTSRAGRGTGNEVTVVVIDGMGGAGKTALAVHVAHLVAERFPDGHFFIDLHGFSPDSTPFEPGHALQVLLEQSGMPPERIPADLEMRSALWRAQTAGRRALLLLDNASDVAQIRPLLPGAGSLFVIVTSRRRMASLESADALAVGALPRAQAEELFTRVAGRAWSVAELAELAAVVELCGRLPLAVRIAAARFRERTTWTLGTLIGKLRDQRQRTRLLAIGDQDVSAVLAVSYRYLTAEQRSVFRLLSLHPGDFDAHAVAALAGITLEDADAALDQLFDVNLVLQSAVGRYRFHDLVRDCAGELMHAHDSAEAESAAVRRLLDFSILSACAWCSTLVTNAFRITPDVADPKTAVRAPSSTAEALTRLAAEKGNLLAAFRLARATGNHRHAWQLAVALQPFLNRQATGSESIQVFREALASAQADASERGTAVCTLGIISSALSVGAIEEARGLAEQALAELAETGASARQRMYLLALLAVAQMRVNEFEHAAQSLDSARALAERTQDDDTYARLTHNLGIVSRELGDLDAALAHFHRRLELEDGKTSQARAQALTNIAEAYYLKGSLDEASSVYGRALESSRAEGNSRAEARSHAGLSNVYRARGSFEAALTSGRASLSIARTASMDEMECESLCAIGYVWLCLGRLDEAHEAFGNAADVSRRVDIARCLARAEDGLAHVHLARHEHERARTLFTSAAEKYGPWEAADVRKHLVEDVAESVRTTCHNCACGT